MSKKQIISCVIGLIGGLFSLIGAFLLLYLYAGFISSLLVTFLMIIPALAELAGAFSCIASEKVGGIVMASGAAVYLIGTIVIFLDISLLATIGIAIMVAALFFALYPHASKSAQKAKDENAVAPDKTCEKTTEETATEIAESEAAKTEPQKAETKTITVVSAPAVNTLSAFGMIFAFFMPILGLIFGLVGMRDARTYHGGRGAGMGLSAVIISAVAFVLYIIVLAIYLPLLSVL